MSRLGKAALVIGGAFLVGTLIARVTLGFFHPSLWVSLVLGVAILMAGLVADRKTYVTFFSMRTTRNGISLGWLILLAIIFAFCINYLAVRYDHAWDLTSEGFNSLSDQSVKIVQSMKEPVKIILLERHEQKGSNGQDADIRHTVEDLVALYKAKNPRVSFETYNALSRPDLAQRYGFVRGAYGLYVAVGDKHLPIDQANEEGVTKALLKLTRDKKKIIYFTQGHGERDIDSPAPEALSLFKADLETLYDVRPLMAFQAGEVPKDAAIVAIIGPKQEFFPPELSALRDYAQRGGSFLIAIDPGDKDNMPQMMKTFGVEFLNNFVLDPRASIPGAGNVGALGSVYDPENPITKGMGTNVTFFLLASALRKAPDAPATFTITNLVSTNEQSVDARELGPKMKAEGHGPHVIAIESTGQLKGGSRPFAAILAGDSDFLSNQLFQKYGNRDFSMNAVAALAKDDDLISIRPKTPRGSVLELHGNRLLIVIFGFLFPLPIVLLVTAGVIWFRRRTA